ncbi:branched-chain amino acid ABC transporter permease [Sulfobacillus thermosulfidooxidans]|uniref:branched-chain amino acid ABC transporter permease n=1 Tax=Sulfobacillus thermosulfidooxidans TaxID=28034 RepID=UPI0009ECAEE8|nr:branched-chain amino acid ABC transporter permease [Sulfobacillus thermosulfidooxidans]
MLNSLASRSKQNASKRLLANSLVPLLVLAGFSLSPLVYANHTILFQMMAFMALAQGVNLLYGFTGYLPFGYVGFFGIGAYGMAMSIQLWHFPGLLAVLMGGLLSVIIAIIFSPLLRLSGAYFAISSLAASEVLSNVVSNSQLTHLTGGPYGESLTQSYHPLTSYVAMVVVLVLTTVLLIVIRNAPFGRALMAIREDPVSAAMAGIAVVRSRSVVWLLSALIAGLTGAIFGWHLSVFYPSTVFDLNISILAIVFTLFGGSGTVTGPVLGSIVLYGLYNAIGISEPQYFQLIYGLLIMALVLFLPGGVVSLIQRRGNYVP